MSQIPDPGRCIAVANRLAGGLHHLVNIDDAGATSYDTAIFPGMVIATRIQTRLDNHLNTWFGPIHGYRFQNKARTPGITGHVDNM
jgi:hypothetical protein